MKRRMARREFLQRSGMGTAAAAFSVGDPLGAAGEATPSSPRLNVVHVIADQHQAACTGYEGHPQAITPNLNRMAASGVRFTRAYTQNPICTPSRTSILSGQYCHNHGYFGLNGPPPSYNLPSFFSHFRSNGYRTAAFGKIHTPDQPRNWLAQHCDSLGDCYRYKSKPPYLSEEYTYYLKQLGHLDKEDSAALPEFPGAQQHEGRPSHLPYEHSVEGWTVKKAIQFMDSSGSRPFCVQISLPRPHECYTPDQRFWDMYPDDLSLPATLYNDASHRPPHFQRMVQSLKKMKWLIEPKTFEAGCRRVWHGYLGCITQVDYALGQVMDYLEKTREADRTILIYGSDHGAYEGIFGVPEKAPGICSEAVCRVPSIWRVPGITPAGHVCNELMENIDIAPTIASLCGLPAMETTDGKDLSDLLAGGNQPVREAAVTENPWSKALRWGPWRFVHYPLEMFGADVGELYDLEKDPLETQNLYHDPASQDTVHQCRRRLFEWLTRTTRIVTAWPPPAGKDFSETVEDGKETNKLGVEDRLRRGQLNYI
ncbi:MAG: sulfatase-like hydrolase/transferase [Terriglobia bacterium]